MADLTITAADVRVVKRADEHQMSAPMLEACTAGQYIRTDPTTGKFRLGNATTLTEIGDGFIAEHSRAIGEPNTGLKGPCVLDVGDALSGLDFGASVHLSITDGTLADADSGAYGEALVVGTVIPAFGDTTAKKLMRLEL